MTASRWFRSVWVAAGLALLLGAGRDPFLSLAPPPRELPRSDGATGRSWMAGEFPPVTTQELDAALLPPRIQSASSGAHGDEWQGRAETAWFRVTRRWWVNVAVAGYPQHAGCRLWAEFQGADGEITRVDCPLGNPRERWNIWEIRRPAGAVAVRVVAEDRAADTFGWVAFSHPFRAWPRIIQAAYHSAQIATTIALALTLLWGPGLLWFPRTAGPELRTAFLLGLGPLILAIFGIVVWCLSGMVRPYTAGIVLVIALWLALGFSARRRRFEFSIGPGMARMLALSVLIVVAATAKSSCSRGPEGELFRGTISRNFSIGDRIDSRYPYYVVQVAAHHLAPASPATEGFFFPWTFFSRGPLAGLAAIPVVMATGGQPPPDMPEQRWSPYDPYGFAAYRITMMTLASGIILGLFALLVPFVGERWAMIAGGLLALSPFGFHEVLFTWPKWAATTWVLISFSLAHTRRPAAAGLALGFGFLFHPMTLLWAPWLVLWAAGRSAGSWRAEPDALAWLTRFARTAALFAAALALPVAPWMTLGALMPHLPDTPFAGQGGFIGYFTVADRVPATWQTWWQTRWMNFANTFIPVHVYFSGFDHPRFESAYGPSGRLVKFSFVWWNTLPFGLGLGLWVLALAALARALRQWAAATWLFLIGPSLLLIAYWGWDPLGLMRECGHPLFAAIIVITVVVGSRTGGWLPRVLQHRAVPWFQLPETWLMLWLTTFANRDRMEVELDQLDSLYVAMNILALLLAAWVVSRARAATGSLPAAPAIAPRTAPA